MPFIYSSTSLFFKHLLLAFNVPKIYFIRGHINKLLTFAKNAYACIYPSVSLNMNKLATPRSQVDFKITCVATCLEKVNILIKYYLRLIINASNHMLLNNTDNYTLYCTTSEMLRRFMPSFEKTASPMSIVRESCNSILITAADRYKTSLIWKRFMPRIIINK